MVAAPHGRLGQLIKLSPGWPEQHQEGDGTSCSQEARHQEESAPVGYAIVGQEDLDISIEHGSQVITDPQCGQSQQALSAGPDVGFGNVVDIDLRSHEEESETDPVKG